MAAVLLGKSMGLIVVALSRSSEKGAKLKELGADFVFDPADPNLRKSAATAIAPKKVDLVVNLFSEQHVATAGPSSFEARAVFRKLQMHDS